MKTWQIVTAAVLTPVAVAGTVWAVRSAGDSKIDVPPKPKGLTRYDSEAFDYRGLVIVIDRRQPDKNPNRWRWRIFDADAYGSGEGIDGKQRATRFGLKSRPFAYRSAVKFIDDRILGGA